MAVTINSGNPIPSFTSSVANAATHTMFFDGGGSTALGCLDDRVAINGRSVTALDRHRVERVATPTLAQAPTRSRLTVTDSLGRIGTSSPIAVTVP